MPFFTMLGILSLTPFSRIRSFIANFKNTKTEQRPDATKYKLSLGRGYLRGAHSKLCRNRFGSTSVPMGNGPCLAQAQLRQQESYNLFGRYLSKTFFIRNVGAKHALCVCEERNAFVFVRNEMQEALIAPIESKFYALI